MNLEQDVIVDIKENQVRFFGTQGKMLLPAPATVANLVRTIPRHKLLTTDLLRSRLAHQFNVQGTCPVTTRKALKVIALDSLADVPFWRVVRQDGGLLPQFAALHLSQAAHLEEEGFTIVSKGKSLFVQGYRHHLA
ncbi:MAG: MGMT family protein [Anaerolineae bacterium]|nr:MGMT family protein [Anaerolineae bacterium]